MRLLVEGGPGLLQPCAAAAAGVRGTARHVTALVSTCELIINFTHL